MHLIEDVCVFELVDEHGHAVGAGERAAKLYITPLFNIAQPLIRYELTDELTLIDGPCACGSSMRRIDDIAGRSDDVFTYAGGIVVHPQTFRSPLGRERHVVEYQVRQTEHGAAIALRVDAAVGLDSLRGLLMNELGKGGVHEPIVTIDLVDGFDRQTTGKFKRFVPTGCGGRSIARVIDVDWRNAGISGVRACRPFCHRRRAVWKAAGASASIKEDPLLHRGLKRRSSCI